VSSCAAVVKLWVVMVTDGTVLTFPPEIYGSSGLAENEAKRWRRSLSEFSGGRMDRDEEGSPWHVGDFSVRLVELAASSVELESPWIGTYWTADGYPDPEALLLASRADALEWVLEPPAGFESAVDMTESEWFVACTYVDRGEETYAVAHRAKQVGAASDDPAPGPPPGHTMYDIEVSVSRLQRIETSLPGPLGLSHEAIEDLVDANWTSIVGCVVEDHVISWDLESFGGSTRLDLPPAE
jgi:hypothetical protein